MKILILGAGAVGGYWGARLTQAGIDTTFLLREKRAALVKANGLAVKSPKGDFAVSPKVVTKGSDGAPYDVVILACKAYDLDSAMDSIAPPRTWPTQSWMTQFRSVTWQFPFPVVSAPPPVV